MMKLAMDSKCIHLFKYMYDAPYSFTRSQLIVVVTTDNKANLSRVPVTPVPPHVSFLCYLIPVFCPALYSSSSGFQHNGILWSCLPLRPPFLPFQH